jgi:hypothetical protein
LLRLAANLIEATGQLRKSPFSLSKLARHFPVLPLSLFDLPSRLTKLLLQVARTMAHGGHVLSVLGDFLLQIVAPFTLVLDGRLVARDPFPVGAGPCLGSANLLVDIAGSGFRLKKFASVCSASATAASRLVSQRSDLLVEPIQFLRQAAPVGQSDLRSKFLQTTGVLTIAPSLACLSPNAAKPVLNLIDDVGEPQEILLDTIKPAKRFEFLRLEATDPGCLFENHAAFSRGGLEQTSTLPCSMML